MGLDVFRAPLSEADLARRNPDHLTPLEAALLKALGLSPCDGGVPLPTDPDRKCR